MVLFTIKHLQPKHFDELFPSIFHWNIKMVAKQFLECQNQLPCISTSLLSYRKSKSDHLPSSVSHQYFLHILNPCQLIIQCASFSQGSLMLLQKWCEQLNQLFEYCQNFSNNPSRNGKFARSTIVILLFTRRVNPKPVHQMSFLLDGSTLLTTIAQNV